VYFYYIPLLVKGWFSLIEMGNYSIWKLEFLNDSALDLRFVPGTKHSVEGVTDASTYYLVYINNFSKKEVVKSSYAPKFYQRNAPTWDRDTFIRLYENMSYLFTSPAR